MGKSAGGKTVPQPFRGGTKGKMLKASDKAVTALVRRRLLEEEQRAQQLAERRDSATHLAAVEREAKARGEEVQAAQAGPLHIVSRDGLTWVMRKGTISIVHYDAGLRFRKDYETANGTGVGSALGDQNGKGLVFDPMAGPTQAMLESRDAMKAAVKALGTPLLRIYVELLAGEGVMLTDPRFGDPKRADEHKLPCRIAFDMLARHYGMIV